jgi:hypothetical protein
MSAARPVVGTLPNMRTLWAAAAVAIVGLTGCSRITGGAAAFPHGIVFVREAVGAEDTYPSGRAGMTRAYRDGRLIATYPGQVLVARDEPAASLVYDHHTRRARSLQGGPWRAFSPCSDPYNDLHYALSPNGRRGLCFNEYADAEDLTVFDAGAPMRTRYVAFKASSENRPYIAGWIDNDRIATIEYRPNVCPFHRAYGFPPGGLVVIDLHGHVLERGPCMAGVVAGPRGLVYVEWKVDYGKMQSWLPYVFGRPQEHPAFSTDAGRSWHFGWPQFADDDGRVYYLTGIIGTLHDDSGAKILGGVYDAAWARAGNDVACHGTAAPNACP